MEGLTGAEPARLPLQNVPMPPEAWAMVGACKAHPQVAPTAWFSDSRRQRDAAKQVCRDECDVKAPCLVFALRHPGLRGIWGGESWKWRKGKLGL